LGNREKLAEQSRLARSEMERLYSLENTYGRLMTELAEWVQSRKDEGGASPGNPSSHRSG
jgi:hypothetical protein